MNPVGDLPRHLYVHVPFCARRCSYCDFAVHVASRPPTEAWAAAVGAELGCLSRSEAWLEPLPLETLYVGGGTPSQLGVRAMRRMVEALRPYIDAGSVEEFTAEANPESFDTELARDWVATGIGRVSFGVQTFHEPSLRWMGRLHGPDGPAAAVAAARTAGFGDIGLDLIFALPERLGRDLGYDLDRILSLEPDHISVYGLSVEAGTPLGHWVAAGRESVPDHERYREEYLLVADRLRAEGYDHYEVSNFARPGRQSRHNSAYWSGRSYVGLGNGAHSYIRPRRWWNRRDWLAYRSEIEAGGSGRADEEVVGPAAARLERIWLGLRTREGLARAELPASVDTRLREWERAGWLEPDPVRVRLSVAGWLLLDRLAVELDEVVEAATPDGVG